MNHLLELLLRRAPRRSATVRAYLYACGLMAIALAARFTIAPVEGGIQYVTFFPAVALTAIIGGIWPGLFGALIAIVLANYFFWPPYYSFDLASPEPAHLANAVFFVDAILVCSAIEAMHRLYQRALDGDERFRSSQEMGRQRAAELQGVLNAVPAAIWLAHDSQCLSITGNSIANEWLGLPPGAEASLSAPEARRPTNYRALQQGFELRPDELPLQRAARGEEIKDFEVDIVRDDGSVRHALAYATPFRSEDGQLLGAVGVFIDITARKQTEKALLESQQRYRKLFDTMTEGFAVHEITTDAQGHATDYVFLDLNPAFERLTGLVFENVVGRKVSDVIPNLEPYWLSVYGRVALTGEPAQFEKFSQEFGRWYGVLAYQPAPRQFAVIFSDITDRKRAEEELREVNAGLERRIAEQTAQIRSGYEVAQAERQRLYSVLETLPVYVILLTTDYHVSFANKYFRERFGESHGRRCFEYLFGRSAPCEVCDTYTTLQTGTRVQWEWRGPDGRDYEIHDFPFTDSDGSTMIMEMGIDVTERKRAEAQLKELNATLEERIVQRTAEAEQANRTKSIFLANMSHEIRTPLNVIVGLANLLAEQTHDSRQQTKLYQLIENSEHLLAVINDVLDLSKIDAQTLSVDHVDFALDAVVARVKRMFEVRAAEKGLSLQVELPPELQGVTLCGDPSRLAQVLINLCGNAVKFTHRGTVTVRVARLAKSPDVEKLRFSVTDTGIGIDAADQEKIFHAFQQADASLSRAFGGNGLGLTISQRLVRLMGGDISLESRLGAGSTFSFDIAIPRGASVQADEPNSDAGAARDFHGARVLIAEDHLQSQELLLEMLNTLGCDGEIASDGGEAVECAKTGAYAVILLDMHMPNMDGLAAARAIRRIAKHADTPIIALTANAFVEDRRQCLDAGMDDHLTKPLTLKALATALSRWLPSTETKEHEPDQDSPLGLALAKLPGLKVGEAWRRSEKHAAGYCDQLSHFVETHAEDAELIMRHIEAGEHEEARGVAHRLMGVAGLLGVATVAAAAGKIEATLRSGEGLREVLDLAIRCSTELRSLDANLKTIRGTTGLTTAGA